MTRQTKKTLVDRVARTAAEAYTQLLANNELASQFGAPWLTAAGVSQIRRLLHASANGVKPFKPPAATSLIPEWNAELGELWLGGEFLLQAHPASNPGRILSAIHSQGWTTLHVDNPLSKEPGAPNVEARERLVNTVKYLNRRLPARTVHFRSMHGGVGVRWEYAPTRRRRKRKT
jgi:hypothetical protein